MARARDFSYPLLVLTGGSDPIADPAASRAFVAACGSADRTLREHPGLRHEVFNERTRERTIADAVAWLAERAPREGAKAIDASRA
jgi:alpha-beta hydrolase superfamily lysophospholipase